MKKENIFDDLRKKLKNKKYAERFIEELQDHFEDQVYDKSLKGMPKKQAEEEALKSLSNTGEIAHNFNVLTREHSDVLQILDSFLFGLLALPLFIFGTFLADSVMKTWDIQAWIAIFIGHILLVVGYFIFYSYSFSYLRPYFQQKDKKIFSLLGLFLPALTYIVLTFSSEGLVYQTALKYVYFIIGIDLAWLTYNKNYKSILGLAERRENKKQSTSKFKKWFGVGLTLYIMATNVLVWLEGLNFINLYQSIGVSTGFMVPRMFISTFLYFINLILFSGNIMISTWTVGIFLCLYILRSLYVQIKNKKINWIQVAIIMYLVPILFLFPLKSETFLTWHMEPIYLSDVIEQKQLGPFHHFAKYVNQEEGALYDYHIEPFDDGFRIYQKGGTNDPIKSYNLYVENSGYRIEEEKYLHSENNIDFSFVRKELPPEVKCDQPNVYFYGVICEKLFFKNHLIVEKSIIINNLFLSPDHKWLLIERGNGVYDPEYLYLIKLKE